MRIASNASVVFFFPYYLLCNHKGKGSCEENVLSLASPSMNELKSLRVSAYKCSTPILLSLQYSLS